MHVHIVILSNFEHLNIFILSNFDGEGIDIDHDMRCMYGVFGCARMQVTQASQRRQSERVARVSVCQNRFVFISVCVMRTINQEQTLGIENKTRS